MLKKDLVVGEDTFQYLELKDLSDRKELNLVYHNECYPTYIYDVRISGIAINESQKNDSQGFLVWMEALLHRLQDLKSKGKLHNTKVKECHTV